MNLRIMLAACCFASAAALLVLIAWASMGGSVITSLMDMAADPWGATTLLDLGLGLVFAAGWMLAVEERRAVSVPCAILIFGLGNLVTVLFLGWRLLKCATVHEALLAGGTRCGAGSV